VEKPSIVPVLLILINVVLGSAGQLSLKYGVNCIGGLHAGPGPAGLLTGALKAICTPYVFLGFALYGLSAIIWLNILSQVRLSIAYPMISLSYVVVVILSSVLLKERVSTVTIAGLLFICLGVSLIGIGYGSNR
jgi:drug/metabolite transporter (DMT)-like permease